MQPTKSGKQRITAERYTALSRVGTALMSELDESRLLLLIAETACELTDASFAAFTLRPVDEEGQPLVASEGNLFHLAAVVGVTKQQEELFRRMPLGGEGLLAPIFRQGVPVLVEDALSFIPPKKVNQHQGHLDAAREAAISYAHGFLSVEGLQSMGVPRGHPVVRSFLGVPLLNRDSQVRGGLLLGHTEPGKFTQEDEALLVGLAAQAAVALENARLYRAAKMRAQELNTIFESIADGIALVDNQGKILRENSTARHLREILNENSAAQSATSTVLQAPDCYVNRDELAHGVALTVANEHTESRDYIINATPLRIPNTLSGPLADPHKSEQETFSGAVVVWHDVTESRRLLIERRILAETEARRALLQTVLDELPSSVYLVRGQDARLVLANRAAATVWGAPWPPGQPMADFLKENGIRIFSIEGHILAPEELAPLRAVQNGETVRHHQEVIRHPDGTTLPVLVNAVALDAHDLNVAPFDLQKHSDTAEKILMTLVESLAFTLAPANKSIVIKTMMRRFQITDSTVGEEGYQDYLTSVERKPIPSLDALRNIRRLMAAQNPKLPPQDIEMEKALLGALLINQGAMYEVADLVGIDSFYAGKHRTVFDVTHTCWKGGAAKK